MPKLLTCGRAIVLSAALLCSAPAFAQETEEPRRTRIGLGAQLVPSFPGSDEVSIRPLFDIARARGDEPFEFEAADEGIGFPILRSGGLGIGPAFGFEGSRDAEDVGADLPEVDFTIEAGAFVQYAFSDAFRVRAEARRGLNGHEGWIGTLSADYIAREGDRWLFSIGPRLTFADTSYQRAYFGVAPQDAAPSGLPAFDPEGGLQSAGATAAFIAPISGRWGIYTYAKYDRLVGDAGESPIVRQLGSRDQFSGGIALTYTFGGRR